MDLAVLNSSFKRERLVENFNSLVWTERHSTAGDFQLVSNNISEILDLLPLGEAFDPPTVVSIADSDVPMVVEHHSIDKPKNGMPQITTTGRAFETVMEDKVTVKFNTISPTNKRRQYSIVATSAAIAAYELIKDIIVDGEVNPLDVIPEINLVNLATTVGASTEFSVEPKDLYAWAIETLALGKFGIRSELDVIPGKITIAIYEGLDLTDEVSFDVALDQVDDPKYLLTKSGYKNVMYVSGQNQMEVVTSGTPQSGLTRRVGYLGLESELTAANGTTGLDVALQNRGFVALADRLPTQLFSGGVSQSISSGYNSRYSLGDLVVLQGEYGLSQIARVAEFVRTQDTTGFKAYPTFEAVA